MDDALRRRDRGRRRSEGPARALLAGAALLAFAYLFFLAIDLLGGGLEASFAIPVQTFLHDNAAHITELRSFVAGLIGTALIQSSSTVTSMAVVMTREGIIPLLIAAGLVHGANLGTSVTSTVVALATEAPPLVRRRPLANLRKLLLVERGEGFERSVGTAVVHDFFNIILITAILLFLELPFGWILRLSEHSATWMADTVPDSGWLLSLIQVVSPKTYTEPVRALLLDELGVPGWAIALVAVPLLFVALKGFSTRMREVVLAGTNADDVQAMGAKLLGTSRYDTFLRGLVLTALVQSSSVTTSLVVPLAAMGFFEIRKIFPFILGANIGTTFTAVIAATSALGQPGFHAGMTIALAHVYLNSFAVFLAWVVPGLEGSVIGSAQFLAEKSRRRPWLLLGYLFMLTIVAPVIIYTFAQPVAAAVMTIVMLTMLLGPHVYLRRKLEQRLDAQSKSGEGSSETLD